MGGGLGESAFKKAIHAREHRERSQPAARAKLGILEKHKDYVKRARDYHRKQKTLKGLKIRASNKNPDEFHFGMIKSRMVMGKHEEGWCEKMKSIPADMLKLMKTQDVSYISLQKNSNVKKLKVEQEELAILEAARKGPTIRQHIIFAEDNEEKNAIIEKITKTSLTVNGDRSLSKQKDKHRSTSATSSKDEEADDDALLEELVSLDPAEVEYDKKKAMVGARQERVNQLEKLEYKMRLDTQLLDKGRRRKIGTDEYGFAKFKWQPERKK